MWVNICGMRIRFSDERYFAMYEPAGLGCCTLGYSVQRI